MLVERYIFGGSGEVTVCEKVGWMSAVVMFVCLKGCSLQHILEMCKRERGRLQVRMHCAGLVSNHLVNIALQGVSKVVWPVVFFLFV